MKPSPSRAACAAVIVSRILASPAAPESELIHLTELELSKWANRGNPKKRGHGGRPATYRMADFLDLLRAVVPAPESAKSFRGIRGELVKIRPIPAGCLWRLIQEGVKSGVLTRCPAGWHVTPAGTEIVAPMQQDCAPAMPQTA